MNDKNFKERRKNTRFDMENYPASITFNDQKTRVVIGNISRDGLLVKTSETSAKILAGPRHGFFNLETANEIKLNAIFPYKANLRKLDLDCKIVYTARATNESKPDYAIYMGLKIVSYNGTSENVLKETLEERKLPNIAKGK